jgi:hypothetical protein
MGLYVMLSTLSESGRKVLRERPGWIKKVNADVQRMGARGGMQGMTMAAIPLDQFIDGLESNGRSPKRIPRKKR